MTKKLTEVITNFKLGTKILRLVFESSPRWATFYFTTNVINSLIPTLNLYIGKLAIDSVVAAIKSPDQAHIQWVFIWAIAAFAIDSLNDLFRTLASHGYNTLKDIFGKFALEKVISHAADLDVSYFEDPKFHDHLEKVQREIYGRPVRAMDETMEILSSFIGLVSLLVIILQLSWWAPLVVILAQIPRFLFRLKFSYWTFSLFDNRSTDSRKIYQIVNLFLYKEPAKEIKTLGLKNYLLKSFNQINDKFIKENRNLSKKQGSYIFAMDVLSSISGYGLTLFAAYRAILGQITIGDLIMFRNTTGQFQGVLTGIFSYLGSFFEHTLFLSRYFEFLALTPKIVSPTSSKRLKPSGSLMIEFRQVNFGYDSERLILKNVSFTISDARNFALVGENGAGKTTIVKLMLRLYDVTSGEILINGIDIKELSLEELRANIGVIFQDFQTYEMTVAENIAFGDSAALTSLDSPGTLARIKKAAELSGAAEFIEKFPNKYQTMLGKYFEKGEELSGGEWQKIALARAFFKDSRILVMDEPTSALDPKSEYEVFKNLISHTSNKSLVLISHRFSTVRLADQIIVIHEGRVIEQGSHEQLVKKNGQYAKLYNLQAKWYR